MLKVYAFNILAMPTYTKRSSSVPRLMITFRLAMAPYKPSHPDAPAPYLSAPTRPVCWCVYTAIVLPRPVPSARFCEILRSAALNTIDNCTEEGVGLFTFLFTSRNFLQPVATATRTDNAAKEYI